VGTDWERYGRAALRREKLPRLSFADAVGLSDTTNITDSSANDIFERIVRNAGLGVADAELLAVVAVAELDPQAPRWIADLGEERGVLTVGLLRALLGDSMAARLGEDAPLRRAALVDVAAGGPLATAAVGLPRRVAWALMGELSLDPGLPPDTDVVLADGPGGVGRVLVSGPDRVRRLAAAAEALAGIGFLACAPPDDERAWRALVAQASVVGAGLILDLRAPAPGGQQGESLDALCRRWVERAAHLPIGLTAADPIPLDGLPEGPWVEVDPEPAAITDQEWFAQYGEVPVPARRPDAGQLRALANLPGAGPQRLASGALLRHARRVTPRVGWGDLVLPPAQERRLRDLADRYRHRERVHEQWGLPLFPSPGVVALFSGPSGTGKTTSAEVIASELGVEMFRVDLSALVSKYIGETEKNLEEIFSAAHAGDFLLLFDEADSLFGTRSAVTDARDRYANMEVSYLLQRLETYDGLVVLTSNFQGNIDDAFLRRIHVSVHFPMPTPEDRARIWDRCLASAPRREVDLGYIAKTFELSGGSIRNAALTAAFLAAARAGEIGMVELLTAVSQELTKLRKRVTTDQFGRWAAEVDGLV